MALKMLVNFCFCSSREELKELLSDGIHVRAYLYQLNCDDQFNQKYYPHQKFAVVEARMAPEPIVLDELGSVYVNGFGNQSADNRCIGHIYKGFRERSKAIMGFGSYSDECSRDICFRWTKGNCCQYGSRK